MIPLIYHPIYSDLPLPERHRYPILKYRHLYERLKLERQNSSKWSSGSRFVKPEPLSIEQIKQVHHPEYVDALTEGTLPAAKMRRIGFPWSRQLIERTLQSSGGSAATALLAIESGCAIHLSGGYHHAHYDFGSGFCLFNDLVLAADQALTHPDVDKVLIVDCDVHQGDGSASLCAERDDIITLSLHCHKNFPSRKPSSDIDIGLENSIEGEAYLEQFCQVVEMAIRAYQPDLIIYDAGVDVHLDDELGYLNLSTQDIYHRDRAMFSLAKQCALPIAAVVGGGYRNDHEHLVEPHFQLFKAAMDVFA
jgi:acetoin utilization deacetylase AcuC-like enzyme